MTLHDYQDAVFAYCEYLQVDKLTEYYAPESVAASFAPVIYRNWELNISHRMTAIMLWTLTMDMITRLAKKERIN